MTHQYESEILNKLMERDGFNIPSSVPPYEAEIKAYLINQVKQAYPKLTDYEAEWLLYNYTKHLPAEFPISSVSDVTEATFENVVPFAYQSAILKGQTLVNLNASESAKISSTNACDFTMSYLKPNTIYTIIFEVSYSGTESSGRLGFLTTDKNNWNVSSTYDGNGSYKKLLTTDSNIDLGVTLRFRRSNVDGDFAISNVIVLEGDYTNKDIPYFTGMQSVKMPVLTTTGKNLFDRVRQESKETLYGTYYFGEGQATVSITSLDENVDLSGVSFGIRLTESQNIEWMLQGNNIYNSKQTKTDFHLVYHPANEVTFNKIIKRFNIQIEKGSVATSYEPYKTNILTVNEEVELRGVGGVKDELDCVTGEITQRIGEIVLDGSEEWIAWGPKQVAGGMCGMYTKTKLENMAPGEDDYLIICDTLPISLRNELSKTTYDSVIKGKDYIGITMANKTLDEMKAYLKSNPITVQYPLNQESIKTVDLTTVTEKGETTYFMPLEGTMHVQSSGEIIQPTFDMSVPVEATTQNLASFIDLEMEE